MQHSEVRWNPELEEWFCPRCGQTSDHLVRKDAQAEMALFDCNLAGPPSSTKESPLE